MTSPASDDDIRPAEMAAGRATSAAGRTPSEPDVSRLLDFVQGPVDIRSLSLTGLFVLAALYSIYVAKPFLLPIATAVLLNFLLSPLVDTLVRLRLPRSLAAAGVLLSLVGLVGLGLYVTAEPAQEWLDDAPRHFARIEEKLRRTVRPVEQVGEAAERVEQITAVGQPSDREVQVAARESLSESLFAGTQQLIATGAIVLALLYFLLATEDLFLRKLVRVLPRLEDKKLAVEIARRIQRDVSVHLATITVINLGLGIVVGVAMHLLDMPSPILWGLMAAAFNFVPYLGAAVGTFAVAVVALLTMDDMSQALLVPLAYGLLTGIEGSLVTPAILGRRLSLNPVVIFLGIFYWGWVWGIPGALLAVPMLLVVKVFCDRIPPLAAIGEFLGR